MKIKSSEEPKEIKSSEESTEEPKEIKSWLIILTKIQLMKYLLEKI